jgi:hypothetical protein
MRQMAWILSAAVIAAAGVALTGCEVDDSLRTRPRTSNPFSPDDTARDNAERRALENPGREVPTGTGGDAPRQLNRAPLPDGEARVVTLQAGGGGGGGGGGAGGGAGGGIGGGTSGGGLSGPGGTGATGGLSGSSGPNGPTGGNTVNSGAGLNNTAGGLNNTGALSNTSGNFSGDSVPTGGINNGLAGTPAGAAVASPTFNDIGTYSGPTTVYRGGNFPGPLPHLPANPGNTPMVGGAPVPGTPWSVDFSWGQGIQLQDYPHRPWPDTTTGYQVANVKHNPVYYFNVGEVLPQARSAGTLRGDFVSDLYEIPWFYLQTAALPVLMVLEPPLAQRTSDRSSTDPLYRGYLPGGPVVPAPIPGVMQWDYPFLNPDGSIKENATNPNFVPATTMPAGNR